MSLLGKYSYRRTLPHMQPDDRALFATFCTCKRWILPEQVRAGVLDSCLYETGRKFDLEVAVIMPDHVHMIFWPLRHETGQNYSIPEIMKSIKSASAHKINRNLNRRGAVWQAESFDHAIRSSESLADKIEYVLQNPVRKGLVRNYKITAGSGGSNLDSRSADEGVRRHTCW